MNKLIDSIRLTIIRPVLKILDPNDTAENLILGTALQESGFTALVQTCGPALGFWQMEPETHDDCWQNFLQFRPALKASIQGFTCTSNGLLKPPATEMIGNLYYACAMARVKYLRISAALPEPTDALALATFYKQWYNTPQGAATVAQALPHFQLACEVSP